MTRTPTSGTRALPLLNESPPVDHAVAAAEFTSDEARTTWHDNALWWIREKRDVASSTLPEWETLRALASGIKEHTLTHLDAYLEQFEAAATRNGATVHWARDAAEHNAIVHGILAAAGATRLVKSKSMLTEECELNPFLQARGIEVVDTDLGERIVQLSDEPPSHIVMPAIHLRKEEIGATFHEHLHTPRGLSDPVALAAAARVHLREKFLNADASLTGVNFAVAESGTIVVCTNEGNADLGTALAPIHIASMGIEKLIPRAEHLPVFLRMLARSATGQPLTVYTSHISAPRAGQQLHIILVDNGRSAQLARPDFWRSLKCIRCGACMNTCPIYRRSGGHSYGSTVPGPIGSVLTPGLDLERYASLPFASTLCGSCTAVCPVKIDLDTQLYKWRHLVVDGGHATTTKRVAMQTTAQALSHPFLTRTGGALLRTAMRMLPSSVVRHLAGNWGKDRQLPEAPAQSFRSWYREHRRTS